MAAGSVALLVLGWLFGLPEATAAGVAGLTVLTAATAVLGIGGDAPELRRTARPPQVSVDEPCRIVVRAQNRSAQRTPITLVTDDVGEHGTTALRLAPLRPGERSRIDYSFPTSRRGVHRVGPLVCTVQDPFELVTRRSVDRRDATVVVAPRIVALPVLPPAIGDEPELGARSMAATSTVDEEFTGLRPYVPGDDLRRIHWPSSARARTPLVRQFEVPWQHRTTVLLDLRGSRTSSEGFERAVVVAASAIAAAASASELVRFATTEDPTPHYVAAATHIDELMYQLAAIAPTPSASADPGLLARAIEQVTTVATGRLVVCTGRLDAAESDLVDAAAARAGVAVVVTTDEGADAPNPDRRQPRRIRWNGVDDLAALWVAEPRPSAPTGVDR